jgi:hypothetical protein
MAIAQTAEGCKKEYETNLNSLINVIISLIKDNHPRVRFATIHCIAQLCTDLSPTIQSKYHQIIVPTLIMGMKDKIPKVQSHAATAVVNYVEECERRYIEPYLDSLLTTLMELLKFGRRDVQEQSLSAISSVADCANNLFIKYYDSIIPFLKEILYKANTKQDKTLRARSMECLTLIGLAVGKEKFLKDAIEIMNITKTIFEQNKMEPDDPHIHYYLHGWARIAKCIKQDFVPFLNFVIPPIFTSALLKPEVYVTDVDDEIDEDEDDEGMETVILTIKGAGEKKISIKTSTLEEKSMGCKLLYSYCYELQEYFYNFVEKNC